MYESYRGRSDRVQWLLARGADENIANIHGTTPLFKAVNARFSKARRLAALKPSAHSLRLAQIYTREKMAA
jgi:hypothetical protein